MRSDCALIMKSLLIGLSLMMAGCQEPFVPDAGGDWKAVATGGDHTCALTSTGGAYCWGRGADGELGTGDLANELAPRPVAGNLTFKSITAGDAHTCALDETGRAFCWGWSAFYQVGASLAPTTRVPVQIDGNERFSAISAGAHHTCGIALDARVFCWGYNRWGQNGNGFTQTTNPAAPTTGNLRATHISSGGYHTCALTATGTAFCWGNNQFGQLGIGSDTLFTVDPMAVRTSLQFKSIDAGATHTCAIATNDRVHCWGSAEFGELGDGAMFKPGLPGPSTPVGTILLDTVKLVSAGVNETCAVQITGGAFCWGRGTEGQLGNGNPANFAQRQPVKPQGKFDFDVLATGGYTHACGITKGTIYCWGTGQSGQLGIGSNTSSIVPQRISSR